MKCQSYFPVYHPHYDLNVDTNGGTSPMYNGNTNFRSGHYNEYVTPLPQTRGPPFAYKELLRQTMILHEDTFKEQVQELHRLYRRQKDLMEEIKSKEMHLNHSQIEDQSSNSSSAKYAQNVLHNIPFFNSHSTPSTRIDNIQTSLCSVKEPKPLDFAESKVKKIGGKLLDLELPAEVYIDSDEEESLQATPPTTLSPNKFAKIVIESDVKSYAANRSLNSVLQGEILSPCLSSQINTNLADLNESLINSCLEESGGDKVTDSKLEISEINHDLSYSENSTPDGGLAQSEKAKSEVGPAGSGPNQARKLAFGLGQNLSVIQALPSLNSELSYTRGAKISGRKKLLKRANSKVTTRSSKSSCSGSKPFEVSVCFVSAKKNLDLNCIDLNSIANSSLESTPSSSEIFTEGETTKKSKRCRMIDINLPCDLTIDDPLDYENSNEPNTENNNCFNGEEINLEAPISSKEGSEPLVGLANIAAEVIVSLSSSHSRSYPKFKILHKSESSNIRTLEWFAGIVSSISIDTSDIIDDYEVMTLNLTEMKSDEYFCKNTTNAQISSESCSNLLSQTRKGRTRRSKRKDFQREVLPSLASLSRYEVTEDIQLIEGLMDAAGTPWQLSRTRRASRMGRKPRVVKQQTLGDDVADLLAVMRWGKVSRRTRGRRSPASPTVLLKWVECVI